MKSLLTYINEGSWGYELDQNDGTLDLRGDIWNDVCELIYDKCNKSQYNSKKYDTDYAWEALGNIIYFLETFGNISDFGISGEEFNKYYYFWRLIDKKKTKNIVDLLEKLISQCQNDEKWINGWKEPDKIKESLNNCLEKLEHYKELYNQYKDHWKNFNKQSDENKQAEVIE